VFLCIDKFIVNIVHKNINVSFVSSCEVNIKPFVPVLFVVNAKYCGIRRQITESLRKPLFNHV